jgi:hypothetical protein
MESKEIIGAVMMVTPTMSAAAAMVLGDNVTGGDNAYNNLNQLPAYSIRIDDKWYPYRLIEPLRWTLGPAADLKDLLHNIDWEASDAQTIWTQAIAGVAGAYLKPMMDTLFLNTLADTITAVGDFADGNPGRITGMIENYVLGMVPNAANQINRLFLDDSVHELDGFMAKLKSRVPGLSSTLPSKVGFLGEMNQKQSLGLLPIQASDHRVYVEMQHLGMDIPEPPKVVNGTEMNMTERAYFRIAKANPGVGMQSLAESYDELFKSDIYRAANKEDKAELITKVSNQYNKFAKQRLESQIPRLQRGM